MKKGLLVAALLCLGVGSSAFAGTTHVNGYTRANGTVVQGYTRSTPDQYRSNNLDSENNGGSQRDEYSNDGGATNKSNPAYGTYDNDHDGKVNSLDRKPENKKEW